MPAFFYPQYRSTRLFRRYYGYLKRLGRPLLCFYISCLHSTRLADSWCTSKIECLFAREIHGMRSATVWPHRDAQQLPQESIFSHGSPSTWLVGGGPWRARGTRRTEKGAVGGGGATQLRVCPPSQVAHARYQVTIQRPSTCLLPLTTSRRHITRNERTKQNKSLEQKNCFDASLRIYTARTNERILILLEHKVYSSVTVWWNNS